jgi:acetolactate synthase small subunit
LTDHDSFLFGFDHVGFNVEAVLVVVVEKLIESRLSIGFTGEDAVVQLGDRVFEVVFAVVKVIIDPLAGPVS